MATPTLVQDLMVPAGLIEAGVTIAEAFSILERTNAIFGVVSVASGGLIGLITKQQLLMEDKSKLVQALINNMPRRIIVEPDIAIADAVRILAKDIAITPTLTGIIVSEGSDVKGVVPRETMIKHAGPIKTRQSGDRPVGPPLAHLFFECPTRHERKLVTYYDPKNPPRCSCGRMMKPVLR